MKPVPAFLLAAFLCGAAALQAQPVGIKIGYTSPEYILSLMPESKQIQSEYKSYEAQLNKQLEARYNEIEKLGREIETLGTSMEEVTLADKKRQYRSLTSSFQEFQRDVQASLQQKQVQLYSPVFEKIQNTITEVALENGYTHVFSTESGSSPVILFVKEEDHLTDLVLARLGIEQSGAN